MDRVNKQTRSRVMSKIRSKNTQLEQELISALKSAKLPRFARYVKHLPGTPDIVFRRERVVVFLDSCFWHGCSSHLRMPKTNVAYWEAKIAKNRKRDLTQRSSLRRSGWQVVRVWEHELGRPKAFLRKLRRALEPRSG